MTGIVGQDPFSRSGTLGAFLSKGIDDNADANAITIASDESVTISGDLVPSSQFSNRNVIYNGGMQIYQRGAGSPGTSNGGFALDRWRYSTWGSPGVVDVTQDSDVPSGQGFSSSLKMDVTTADTADAADSNGISMKFEGRDLQRFAKGVSGAKASTVSFWVKSPKTGVHIVWLYDNDNNRQISKSYTVSSANTWENHSVTFPGDTTGAWGNDVNESAQLTFVTMAGNDASSGTLATSWESYTPANRAVGQVNCMDHVDNNFYLTGVQWEVGENATPFEHQSYGDELRRCQRYYFKITNETGGENTFGVGVMDGTTACQWYTNFPVTMRIAPTAIETSGTAGDYSLRATHTVTCNGVPAHYHCTKQSAAGSAGIASGTYFTSRGGGILRAVDNDAYLAWSAEL